MAIFHRNYVDGRETVVQDPGTSLAARVIDFVTGLIIALLALRFLFALLGANPANTFASIIYNLTHPLVAPFFSLFNYDSTVAGARFEWYTLVAMLVYGMLGYLLARLLNLGPHRTVYTR